MEEFWYTTKRLLTMFTHFQKRSRLERYGFALVVTFSVLLLKAYAYPYLREDGSFLLLALVVVVSSWYGGLGPGLFSTLLATFLNYITFLVKDEMYHPVQSDMLLSVIFMIEGLAISILSEARYESDQQKDDFIAYLAHELKNPLSAISGFSTLITKNARKEGYEKIYSYGEIITDSSTRMLQLINDLLDIAKIEIGKFSYKDSFFNMLELTKEVVNQQEVISKNRKFVFKGKTKQILFGDRYRIKQVVINLLTNAVKYSPENKEIHIRLKENKEKITLKVRDFGPGIARSDQRKIFNRFYRVSGDSRNKSDGLGLGLYICGQIVKRHKGKLWVESKLKKGSTFYLELPLRKTFKEEGSKGGLRHLLSGVHIYLLLFLPL